MFRISILIGIIFAIFIGMVSFCKYFSHITFSDLLVLTVMRMFLCFIGFFFLTLIIAIIIRQKIPQVSDLISKGKRVDYTIPPTFPNFTQIKQAMAIEEIKQAEKLRISGEDKVEKGKDKGEQLRRMPPEIIAQAIRSSLVEEK